MERSMGRRVTSFLLLLLTAAAFAGQSRGPAAAKEVALAAVDYRAATLDFANLLATGRYEDAYSRLDSSLARTSIPSRLEQRWKAAEGQAGPFVNFGATSDTLIGDTHVVDLTARFEWSTLIIRVAWDAKGKVSGMRFRSVPGMKGQTAPPSSPGRELEVSLHGPSGREFVPENPTATLTLPAIDGGKVPAVILVSGRERTTLATAAKEFQSHGIVVLRWQQTVDPGKWAGECVPAIRYLQNRIEVDSRRIFLILESPIEASAQTPAEVKGGDKEGRNTDLAGFITLPDARIGGDEVAKLARWILGGQP